LLTVERISTAYQTPHGPLRAVDDVSLRIDAGDTLALVGESGCGKSTFGKTILQLQPASSGSIRFNNVDLTKLKRRSLIPYRRQMQMVFQDPSASLNPRQTVGTILETPLLVHGVRGRKERQRQVAAIIERVGLPTESLARYPHEFSGGQKQRIGIARALVLKPALVVCDEPVSALDVSIQAQILNLLVDLKREFNLSYLFISHDLGVVRYIADRIAVMYLGRIVENAPHGSLWTTPLHPYTRGLIQAVPGQGTAGRPNRIAPITGDLPNPLSSPSGCRFHPRCPLASDICRSQPPELRAVQPDHFVACHFVS
jgi:peptide/nickel transport system ATP-binding protein